MKRAKKGAAWPLLRSHRSALAFCGLSLLTVAYAVSVAPFRAPDEYNHFFRAYQVSTVQLLAIHEQDGIIGGYLPASLKATAQLLGGYPAVPSNHFSPRLLRQAYSIKLNPGEKDLYHFPNTALYSPLVYLPAAVGIDCGRIIGAGPLVLLYLARVANAVAGAALLALAFRRAGSYAYLLAALALFPMVLFEMGTAGEDAVTFGVVFLWLAEWIALQKPGAVPPRKYLFLLLLVLSQTRPPYPMLALLAFALPRSASGINRCALRLGWVSAGLGPCFAWLFLVRHLQVPMRPGVATEPARQLLFVLHHPLDFTFTMLAQLWGSGYSYLRQLTGVFGWLNLPAPDWVCPVLLLLIGLIVFLTDNPPGATMGFAPRIALLCTALLGSALVFLLIYMSWNAPGAAHVEGIQGRYFIPFCLPFLLALSNGSLLTRNASWWRKAILAAAVAVNAATLVEVARWQ